MKVYAVYTSYGNINTYKLFLSKEVAENYKKLSPNRWIEEREVDNLFASLLKRFLED